MRDQVIGTLNKVELVTNNFNASRCSRLMKVLLISLTVLTVVVVGAAALGGQDRRHRGF